MDCMDSIEKPSIYILELHIFQISKKEKNSHTWTFKGSNQ